MLFTILKNERYKLLATFLVAGFFFWFWLNGPIQTVNEVFNSPELSTPFSQHKMVQESSDLNAGFGKIAKQRTTGWGNGLILSRKKEEKASALLLLKDKDAHLSVEHKNWLLANANHFSTAPKSINSSEEMYAITLHKPFSDELYLESKNIVEGIRGYAGPVHIALFIGTDGKIAQVEHVASHETESYLRDIQQHGFYNQFKGLALNKAYTIEAVTGATLTTRAISQTVSQLTEIAYENPLSLFADLPVINNFNIKAELNQFWIVHITIIIILFAWSLQKKWRKSKKSVRIVQFSSLLYIGFFLNNSFTYISFLQPFMGTTLSSLVGLYAFFVLLGAIWGPNTYCRYICPFGNAQRLSMHFLPAKKRRFFIGQKNLKRLRALLALGLTTGIFLGLRNWSNFELFPDLFGLDYLSIWFVIALLTVAITLIYPMLWCRALCPTGALLDLLSDGVKQMEKWPRVQKDKGCSACKA